MSATPIYLDNHSTTRLDPRVLEEMLPWLTERYGNAGSASHAFGWEARDAIEAARASIGRNLGAAAGEIVFTSGATESNNLAIRGLVERQRRRGNHLVSVTSEHKAIVDPLHKQARAGLEVTWLPVRPFTDPWAGWLDPQRVADAIRDDTLLVSVMLANNEIGVIQPLKDIAEICHRRGTLLHTDATQAVGKMAVDFHALDVDLASFSAHKLYGPKGVGGLFVRGRKVRLESQIDGGGQERGRRSGTLNVPGIVGMAAALRLCDEELAVESRRLGELRNRLFEGLRDAIPGVELNGPEWAGAAPLSGSDLRLAHNMNCRFEGIDGEALMLAARDLAVSSGSACTSANPEPSHVLLALGLTEDQTRSSLRFGLGRFNTAEEIERAIELLAAAARKLRGLRAGTAS